MAEYTSLWVVFGLWFYEVLPNSPFSQFLGGFMTDTVKPFMKYLNWFIPIDWCLTTLFVWLGAISAFYMSQAVGRWLKALGS